ncbi:hypothetical protein [Amycolatopsis magusensis]|uniref:hypothetical protein n=1 Tax=Amycolatopsis magusensis TaxID=882444 RepID=UPI0024A8428A|nr:hypothetical protein [Amycolatopsis magusensis]MDI5977891.1 hypothetical protein [Amycolatopsis magusensis]
MDPPEPAAGHRFQDPHAPAPIRFTTGLGTGFGVGALSLFSGLYIYTDLDAFTGEFETRREVVTALLFFVGAPVVGFTYGLTMTRVKRRKALADYAVHRRKVERRVRRLHR